MPCAELFPPVILPVIVTLVGVEVEIITPCAVDPVPADIEPTILIDPVVEYTTPYLFVPDAPIILPVIEVDAEPETFMAEAPVEPPVTAPYTFTVAFPLMSKVVGGAVPVVEPFILE